jgi:hypothetical protein
MSGDLTIDPVLEEEIEDVEEIEESAFPLPDIVTEISGTAGRLRDELGRFTCSENTPQEVEIPIGNVGSYIPPIESENPIRYMEQILGIAQSIPASWFVLEDVVIDQEALKTARIPFIPIAEGISLPSEHLKAILEIHKIESIEGWFSRNGSSDGVVIYSIEKKEEVAPPAVEILNWYGKQQLEFRKMTEEILLPVVNTQIELFSFGAGTRLPVDDGKFRIYIWVTPREVARVFQPPPRIWGIQTSSTDWAYPGTETGIHILDEETCYSVAELIGNNLYIHHNLNYFGTDNELQIYRRILEETVKILKNGYEKSLKDYKDNSAVRARKIYISKCADRIVARIQSLKNEIQKCERLIKEDRDHIIHYIRTMHVSRAALDGLQLRQDTDVVDYGAEYDRLLKMEGLVQVNIIGNKLIAETEKVYVTYDNVEYYLGRYQINIPLMNTGDIRIYNLDETCIKWSSQRQAYFNHPHIPKHGECCFGNLTTGLAKLMGEHQYAIVLQIIVKYLSSANDKDWYLTIEEWK